jgi:hypothetical protein
VTRLGLPGAAAADNLGISGRARKRNQDCMLQVPLNNTRSRVAPGRKTRTAQRRSEAVRMVKDKSASGRWEVGRINPEGRSRK